ncbi:MAG: hypothetical protein ABIS07_01735, partial [Dokdonella sp.]
GSVLSNSVDPYGDSGWMKLDLSGHGHALAGGATSNGTNILINGLPVTGFMVYNIINANAAPNKLANYSGTFPHRSTVSCSNTVSPPPGSDPCF